MRDRTVAARRRRVVDGLAALGLGVAALSACGGGSDDADPGVSSSSGSGSGTESGSDPSPTTGTTPSALALELPDGSTHRFDDATVTCDPADLPYGGQPAADGERVFVLAGPWDAAVGAEDDAELPAPLFYLELDVEAAADGLEVSLPGDEDTVVLFAVADTGAGRANEVSSAEDDSSGTITVRSASCDGDPSLELEVDAVLGSELDQPAMRLSGSLG